MPDLKISGVTAGTAFSDTDELGVNETATPGVAGTSKRKTALMMAQYVTSTLVGVPKTPAGNFTVPTNYVHTVQGRLTLAGTVRATLAGTADLILTDDFGTRSRIVLAGRG